VSCHLRLPPSSSPPPLRGCMQHRRRNRRRSHLLNRNNQANRETKQKKRRFPLLSFTTHTFAAVCRRTLQQHVAFDGMALFVGATEVIGVVIVKFREKLRIKSGAGLKNSCWNQTAADCDNNARFSCELKMTERSTLLLYFQHVAHVNASSSHTFNLIA
jgi:hypothetical protein